MPDRTVGVLSVTTSCCTVSIFNEACDSEPLLFTTLLNEKPFTPMDNIPITADNNIMLLYRMWISTVNCI
jgi:hypothetical protein